MRYGGDHQGAAVGPLRATCVVEAAKLARTDAGPRTAARQPHGIAHPTVRHHPMGHMARRRTHGAHAPWKKLARCGADGARARGDIDIDIFLLLKKCRAPRAFGRIPCGTRQTGARTAVRPPCVPCAGGR
jgi:hypothetical protein